jgi:hypothetical protein
MRKLIVGAMLLGLVVAAVGCKVVVTPSATGGWFFLNEGPSGSNSSGYFVNGPGTPPAGRGSALLTIDATGREAIATGNFSGVGIGGFNQLKYSTYQAFSGSPNETPALEFDVDYDSTDSSTAYQGRLVFVPAENAAVTPGVWQNWDTMAGPAAWYSSGSDSSAFRPITGDATQTNPPCTQSSYCTWAMLKADYPHARIRPKVSGLPGLFLIRSGGPVTSGSVAATDNVIIGVGSQELDTNFEPGDGHVAVTQATSASLGFGFAEETATGSGAFVSGPNGADGSGSAQLTVDSTGGEALANGLYAGTRFDHLTFLSYKTYMKAVGTNAPTLQFDADYDATDNSTAFQGRAVFEPSLAGAAPVTNETWQTWNPLTAPSGWWQTGNAVVGGFNVGKTCTQASPCSFAQLLVAYPDAQIRPITGQSTGQPIAGGIWLKAGGAWAGGFTGNVDSLTIGDTVGTVNGTATYDFEP